MRASRFWLWHGWIPAVCLVASLVTIAAFDLDRRLAQALFYDRAHGAWVGAGRWWAVDLIHGGGALFVRLLGLSALVVWLAGFASQRLRRLRVQAGFVALAMALSTAAVGGLKQLSGVDCPRDLADFGGCRAYAPLFADRPSGQPAGHCYPGAHAASGFALIAFYFAFRNRHPRAARHLLAAAIAVGAVFSLGQQARGAHFLSHDLLSAGLVWFLLLSLWYRLLESDAPAGPRSIAGSASVQYPDGIPPSGTGSAGRPATHTPHARRGRAGLRVVFQRLLSTHLSLRAAPAERGRRGDPRRRAGDARQGHAQDG